MKRLLPAILLLWIVWSPAFAAATAEPDYQKAKAAYNSLQDSARRQMYRENWIKVYEQFQAVKRKYPAERRAADALFMSGKTFAGLQAISRVPADAERAVAIFIEMAEAHQDSSLADDALFLAGGLLEETLDDPKGAYLLYRRLVDNFPAGDMVDKAKVRLKALAQYAPPPAPEPVVKIVPKGPAASMVEPKASGGGTVGGGSLTSIRYWSNPGYTRIVLDVSAEAVFSAHFLAADPEKQVPPRLYVDIETTSIDAAMMDPKIVDDGLLRQIRTGRPQPDRVRVVLDLDSVGDYKVFPLSDPWRIVIDIAGDKTVTLKQLEPEIRSLPESKTDAIATILQEAPKAQQPVHLPAKPASSLLRRIVVDAGHGGKDPGAVGPSGLLEKEVTLNLAKELARELTRLLDCEVILTRSTDVYLPLEERTAIANKVGADLFISVHANANKNRDAFGIETYYLNFSKNDKAAAVAARENGTSLKQVSDLELILFDLMANAKINESSRLAAEIQESLVSRISRKYEDIRDLGVKQGPFYVLLGATMPSVLVETAFISNHREEKRLASDAYRKASAEAIAEAVKSYAVNNKLIAAN